MDCLGFQTCKILTAQNTLIDQTAQTTVINYYENVEGGQKSKSVRSQVLLFQTRPQFAVDNHTFTHRLPIGIMSQSK